ncbi:MAG: NADPH:quinone reductase [bacterium]|nr:NADPH:quinone reductase [bacterium]
MNAAYIEKTGAPEAIRYGDFPAPTPAEGQALVRVKAVSVNPIDVYLRGGMVPAPLPLPYIVGCDLAGVVESVGPGVRRVKSGDRVWGSNQGLAGRQGTFAEYAAVGEEWLYPIPGGVADADAAAVALVGITAHLGLRLRAGLAAGEAILVNGGSGGVGTVVIQMAKALGARVMATAGSDEKLDLCRRLGADDVVGYRDAAAAERIREFAPKGLDVWWEVSREPDFERVMPLMARRGRMILMAGREARPVFPVGPFYTRDCSVLGFAMFNATPTEQRAAADDINRWMAEGRLKPVIAATLPLADAARAHRLQEENTLHHAGTLAGKIVLTIG